MKKVTRIIGAVCMVGLLVFVSTSCKKNQENGEMTINVSIPGVETEGDRAYINEYGLFMWHENDQVRVYNLDTEDNAVNSKSAVYTKIGNVSTQIARFRGPSVGLKKAEGYRVIYPVNMIKGSSDEVEQTLCNENRQTFDVSDRQYFHSYDIPGIHHHSMVDPEAMLMAMKLNKLTDEANLHHMFGVAAFNLNAAVGTTVVVDSVVLQDNVFNIAGEVSAKLHRFALDDSQGVEHNLLYVWDQFYSNYHGFTPEFVQDVLSPELEFLGWVPDESTLSHSITMDCIYEHADGEVKGVTLGEYPSGSFFNFMLRPFALSQGFTFTVYVHDGDPIVLTDADFEHGPFPCDYTWAVKPGKRKIYTKHFPINY